MKSTRAFTLIEVLIALVILAIAMMAILKAVNNNLFATRRLENLSIEHWLGNSLIASAQVGILPVPTPGGEPQQGKTVWLHRTWYWKITADPDSHVASATQINVIVSTQEDLTGGQQLIGFVPTQGQV